MSSINGCLIAEVSSIEFIGVQNLPKPESNSDDSKLSLKDQRWSTRTRKIEKNPGTGPKTRRHESNNKNSTRMKSIASANRQIPPDTEKKSLVLT